MKISVSNIAWETSRMDEHLSLLQDLGCDGMELSPNMIWDEPVEVDRQVLLSFKHKVDSYGLDMPSMHSLTYTRPDLTFLDSEKSRNDLVNYVVSLGEIANLMEIPVMVFGSAKSRRIGNRIRASAEDIIVDSMREIAERLAPLGVTLLIEALSKKESDFINNLGEAYDLIKKVDVPHFSLHVDLRSSFEEHEIQREIWQKYGKIVKHCHVANPGFKPPSEECLDHKCAATAMKQSGYNGFISIEMGRNYGETPKVVSDAVTFVRNNYL